ncbi:MAG: YdgA family protein [Gammaproteobacteria bacterium]|nr:YdgA family protein [Gammaproteobacteria bacterium]
MKKLGLGIAALIILGAAVAPKFVASSIDTQLHEIVTRISDHPGYEAELVEISQGWFGTQAKIKLTADLAAFGADTDSPTWKDMSELAVVLDVNAGHGPILTGDQPGLGWVDWLVVIQGDALRGRLEWPAEQPFYRFLGTTDLLGKTHYQDQISMFSAQNSENTVEFSFSGLKGTGLASKEGLAYRGVADSFTVVSDRSDFKLQQASLDVTMESDWLAAMEEGLYNSAMRMDIAHIEVNQVETQQYGKLDGIFVTSNSVVSADKTLADFKVSYGLKAFEVNQYQGSDLGLDVEINRVSADFVKAYREFAQANVGLPAEELQANTRQWLNQNLLAQLQVNPEVKITSLHGTLPEGQFSSNARAGVIDIDSLPDTLEDKTFGFKYMLVNGNVSADEQVVDLVASLFMSSQLKANPQAANMREEQFAQIVAMQTPVMIDSMVERGFLQKTATGYSADFNIQDGKAKINTLEIPLAQR